MARRPETGDRATVLLVHHDHALFTAAKESLRRLLAQHGGNLSRVRLELSTPERPLADNRALLAAIDALGLRGELVAMTADGRVGRPRRVPSGRK